MAKNKTREETDYEKLSTDRPPIYNPNKPKRNLRVTLSNPFGMSAKSDVLPLINEDIEDLDLKRPKVMVTRLHNNTGQYSKFWRWVAFGIALLLGLCFILAGVYCAWALAYTAHRADKPIDDVTKASRKSQSEGSKHDALIKGDDDHLKYDDYDDYGYEYDQYGAYEAEWDKVHKDSDEYLFPWEDDDEVKDYEYPWESDWRSWYEKYIGPYDSEEYDSYEDDSEEYDSEEYDSYEYDSEEYDSYEYDSYEYDSEEYDSYEYDSEEYDSEEYDSYEYDSEEYDSYEYDYDDYNDWYDNEDDYDSDYADYDYYDDWEQEYRDWIDG